MKRRLFVLFLSSALCLVAEKKQLEPTTSEFAGKIKALRPSIVEIWVQGRRNGTGFVVSDRGHILTANHGVGQVTVENN
jgi:hypothetical protein